MTRRPVARYILHIRCRGCERGSFAAVDGPLPPCVCGLRRWQILSVWDLTAQAWPPRLPQPPDGRDELHAVLQPDAVKN